MPIGEAIATASATALVQRFAPSLLENLSRRLDRKSAHVKAKIGQNFSAHLARSLQRSRHVKTILSKDKPVTLKSIYVPLTLTSDNKRFKDVEMDPTLKHGRRIVIEGTGGAGKTFLMKHLLALSCTNEKGIVPLYFELRSLNLDTFDTLLAALHFDLTKSGSDDDQALLEALLKEGGLCIFLDGFDEIRTSLMEKAIKEIAEFTRNFPLTSILVSTRPGTGLNDLADFEIYRVNPLTKKQVVSLINKTKFDKESKDKFKDAIVKGLYEKHQTMMSLPILVAMMLLTFRSYGDIPDRMTVFYAQAFDTLYSIHDAESKGQFRRHYQSGLAADQFKQVLEHLSYRSFSKFDLEFTNDTLQRYINESVKYEKIPVIVDEFQSDLIKNVCIIQPDGINFVYVHRSFQEYFAARFIIRYTGENHFKIIDKVARRGSSVIDMIDEMNQPLLIREWLSPKLLQISDEINRQIFSSTREKIEGYMSEIVFSVNGTVMSASGRGGTSWDWGIETGRGLHAELSAMSLLNGLRLNVSDVSGNGFDALPHDLQQIARFAGVGSAKTVLGLVINVAQVSDITLNRLNVDEVWQAYRARLEVEIARVQAFIGQQDTLDDELLA